MLKIFKTYRIILIFLSSVFLLFSYTQVSVAWEKGLFRVFQHILPNEAIPAKTTIVALDKASFEQQGQWPWSWSEVSRLIKRLNGAGVSSVGVMLPLDYSQTALKTKTQAQVLNKIKSAQRKPYLSAVEAIDPDKQLEKTLKQSKYISLSVPYSSVYGGKTNSNRIELIQNIEPHALKFVKSSMPRYLRWTYNGIDNPVYIDSLPLPLFMQAAQIGLHNSSFTMGGHKLQEPLVLPIEKLYYPSFELQTAALAMGVTPSSLKVLQDKGVKIGRRKIPTDIDFQFFPKLTRDKKGKLNIPYYSAADVLENRSTLRKLRNKAVIIGVTEKEGSGLDATTMSPVFWSGHVVNAIITNSYFTKPVWSSVLQRCLILAFTFYLLLIPRRARGRLGLAVSTFVSIVLVNASLILLLTQSLWLSLLLPALFLFFAHLFLTLHHHFSGVVAAHKRIASEANRKLASTLLSQGKFDEAFDYLKKCVLNNEVMEDLYKLGLEFERRRQFNQALSVFDYIGNKNANYRDIAERKKRHVAIPEHNVLNGAANPSHSSTLVLDNPQVERPILGRYQIEEVIGKGAMGTVFMGTDPKISRTVAIKTVAMSEEFEQQQLEDVKNRFFREAETAGRLHHPNIVIIYDVGEEHDLAYIAMEYVKGVSLDQYTHSNELLAINEVFVIGIALAEALDYAHSQNVVHRDVKPANMIYNRDSKIVKMTDFGIACLTDNSKTRTGMVLGSPSYMSPEQLAGKKVDGRSDLFSLGVALYQMFTGCLPFTADSMTALAYKIANEKPKSIRKIRSDLPTCLTRLINKSLEKEPKQRFQTGKALAEALRRCQ